jgi:hypothetical protein
MPLVGEAGAVAGIDRRLRARLDADTIGTTPAISTTRTTTRRARS